MYWLLAVATLAGGTWAAIALVGWARRKFDQKPLPTYSANELRRRLRLLVVDDSGFTYLDDFKRDGFDITWWSRVDTLSALEGYRFDVIVLDIHGIAHHLFDRDGLGVSEHIRSTSESLPVIIYSGASYQLPIDTSSADVVVDVAGGNYERFRSEVERMFREMTAPPFFLRHFQSRPDSPISDADRRQLANQVRDVFVEGTTTDAPRYSSQATAMRAAEIVRHAQATAARLRRRDL